MGWGRAARWAGGSDRVVRACGRCGQGRRLDWLLRSGADRGWHGTCGPRDDDARITNKLVIVNKKMVGPATVAVIRGLWRCWRVLTIGRGWGTRASPTGTAGIAHRRGGRA